MATKKPAGKNIKNRRRVSSPPVRAATKKTAARKTKRTPALKTTPKRVAKKRSARTQPKKTITKQLHLQFGPRISLIIQLKHTRSSRRPKKNKQSRERRILLARLLVTAGVIGTAYFTTDIFRPSTVLSVYSPPAPTQEATPLPEPKSKTLSASVPTSIHIPDIALNASLTSVGRRTDNTLEVPDSPQTPAWYRHSPTPGELGPSIIVGHVDGPKGPAVFWRLRELTSGHIIEIKRTDNTTARFKVVSVQQFEQENFPTQEVYGNIDHAGLRLITCGGTFNRITQQYSHNTVIFASLEI